MIAKSVEGGRWFSELDDPASEGEPSVFVAADGSEAAENAIVVNGRKFVADIVWSGLSGGVAMIFRVESIMERSF